MGPVSRWIKGSTLVRLDRASHSDSAPLLDAQHASRGCKGKAKWCEHWLLHKFRATFATWSLWAGVDLRTAQLWLGHADIESTMRYLKPSRSQRVRERVNEIFA